MINFLSKQDVPGNNGDKGGGHEPMPCFMIAPEDTVLTNRSQEILQLTPGLANWVSLKTQY